jgi:hypothetical protein
MTSSFVRVSWNQVFSADSYQIFRNSGSGFSLIGTAPTPAYNDLAVSPGAAYLYKVRAVTSGLVSADSNIDLATTIIFTDDPLVPGTTVVKAVHVTEMRTAVNAVRALANLAAATWTDLSPAGASLKAVHITELRTALDAARSLLVLPPLAYTHALSAGTSPVAATDFSEIRNGTK